MAQKYIFIQDDPFYLPKVLDKVLREFGDSTAGINVQSVGQGGRSEVKTAIALLRIYGPRYFLWKMARFALAKFQSKVLSGWLGIIESAPSVASVAKKYGVAVTESTDVNSPEFLAMLRDEGVELIVSISGTQLYRKPLRDQTPLGIVNCHGALLPKYRGLMPSFWTLLNNETEGGVTVHFVDAKLDSGPIVVQRRYRIWPQDTLEDIMARSKDLAAEAIIAAIEKIEKGNPELQLNDAELATNFSMPTPADGRRFRQSGRKFA